MPTEKGKGTGEPGWTGEEKRRGAPDTGDAGAAGEAVPKAGYGSDGRAATESAVARTQGDKPASGKETPQRPSDVGAQLGNAPEHQDQYPKKR